MAQSWWRLLTKNRPYSNMSSPPGGTCLIRITILSPSGSTTDDNKIPDVKFNTTEPTTPSWRVVQELFPNTTGVMNVTRCSCPFNLPGHPGH